jgi:hypothetical protein
VLFNLGAIAVERRDWNEALEYLKRSLAGSAPSDSIVRKLFALLARTHQMMGDSQGALAACAKGLELDPNDAELWFRKGMVHRQRGESSEAEKCWRLILTLKRPDQFCSVDQGIYGHLTRRNLAVLAAERGDYAEVKTAMGGNLGRVPLRSRGAGEVGAIDSKGHASDDRAQLRTVVVCCRLRPSSRFHFPVVISLNAVFARTRSRCGGARKARTLLAHGNGTEITSRDSQRR